MTEEQQIAEIRRRLGDYAVQDVKTLREKLVRTWQEAYPDAVNESSGVFHPLIRAMQYTQTSPSEPDEFWFNDTYSVTVRRQRKDLVFGSKSGMVQIGISSLDGTARHDWRDFQAIKNQIAGPECEGFELYPAESRLLDPSNYFSLWCFPSIQRIKVGVNERDVRDADMALAPQRGMGK